MTLRQTKWIVGKWIVEMFQRNQHDYRLIDGCFHKNFEVHVSRRFFKIKETTVQGNRNFHILMMYSNYAINIIVTIGSMIPPFTNTLQFIRDGSRAAATSKMEHFVIIFNGWKQP